MTSKLLLRNIALSLAIGVILCGSVAAASSQRAAPAFTHRDEASWINSPPLAIDALRGQVLLLDFWTFDCWSCYRSFAWLTSLQEKYRGQGFRVIGIHTPEFAHERRADRVRDKIRRWGLDHPVMIDNDFSYWNAVGAASWPSFYLVGKKGLIRAGYMGETRIGDDKARQMEKMIDMLLSE